MPCVPPHAARHVAGLLNFESAYRNLINAHLKAIKAIYVPQKPFMHLFILGY